MAVESTSAVQPTRHRFTVAEYYRMAEAGIFNEDSRVELIDGEIVDMPPIGPSHSDGVDRLAELFITRLAGAARVRVQNPVHLREHNEPEPDLVLACRRAGGYAGGHPTPEDILLIVEVADSSIEYDRQTKGPMYARAGIADYWILDLARDRLLVHREPTEDGYAATRVYRRGEQVSPLAFPDLALAVDDILG